MERIYLLVIIALENAERKAKIFDMLMELTTLKIQLSYYSNN